MHKEKRVRKSMLFILICSMLVNIFSIVPVAANGDEGMSMEDYMDELLGATAIHATASEGEDFGCYQPGSKEIFKAAIDNAKAVYNNPASMQEELNQAFTALSAALDEFDSNRIKEEFTVVDVVYDTYEDEIIGSPPAGYEISIGDGSKTYGDISVQSAPDSENKCLKYELSAPGPILLTKVFSPLTGRITLETKILPTVTTLTMELFIGDENTYDNFSSLVNIWFRNTARLICQSGVTTQRDYYANEWYEIKLVMDTDLGMYEFYVNGELWGSEAMRPGPDVVDRIIIKPREFLNSRRGALFIDYIKVTGESGTAEESSDARINSMTVNGDTYSGFSPDVNTYDVDLPRDSTQVPEITGIPANNRAQVYIMPGEDLPGTTVLVGIAEDRKTTQVYYINYSVSNDVVFSNVVLSADSSDLYAGKSISFNITGTVDGVSGIDLTTCEELEIEYFSSDTNVAVIVGKTIYGVNPGAVEIYAEVRGGNIELTSNVLTFTVEQLDDFTVGTPIFTDISGERVYTLKGSSFIKASISITKNKDIDTSSCLIVALYDQGNAVKNLTYLQKTLEMDQTEVFTAGFELPEDTEGYKIKVFVWNNMEDMIPLADVVEFPLSLKTNSHITNAPLQIGVWSPLNTETPDWIFPMVNYKLPQYNPNSYDPEVGVVSPLSPEALADIVAAEVAKRPADQPIWIHLQDIFGTYKKWTGENVLSFIEDFNEHGTPTLWPDNGIAHWKDYTERLLKRLIEKEVRLDHWLLDHETRFAPYVANFAFTDAFKNMVLDPRWNTEPILGLGITGNLILDQSEIGGPNDSIYSDANLGTTDSQLAVTNLLAIGHYYRPEVINKVYTEPALEYYPHLTPCDYGRPGMKQLFKLDELKVGIMNMSEAEAEVIRKIQELVPEVGNTTNGVGPVAAPALYGSPIWEGDKADYALGIVDELIQTYGSVENIIPWIAPPNYGSSGGRHFTPDEYERMLVGLAEKGIRKIMLWNSSADHHTQAVYDEILPVFQKAYEAAEARLNSGQ